MPSLYDVIRGIVRGLVPETDYLALYPSTVIVQDSDGTLQIKPDSSKIPPLAGVRIRSFAPQVAVELEQGARVLLGFEGGDPDKPYAALWGSGTVTLVTIGAPGSAQYVALADKVNSNFAAIQGMFDNWTVVPNDGGAALKLLSEALSLDDVDSEKLKTE